MLKTFVFLNEKAADCYYWNIVHRLLFISGDGFYFTGDGRYKRTRGKS